MRITLLALVVLACDQLGKYYIQTCMQPGLSIPVINGVFHFTYVLNPGAAFGIMQNNTLFFLGVAAALFAAVLYLYPRLPAGHIWLRIGIGLLLGGAAGNFIDRMRSGYVIDFLDFRIWPVFNIADIAIVVGVALIIYDTLYLSTQEVKSDD